MSAGEPLGLGEAVSAIRRRYGAAGGAGWVATGSWVLDRALGGGWPRAAITELSGDEGTGKTTLGLCAASGVVRSGGTVGWIDAEGAFPGGLARTLGVASSQVVVVPPDSGERLYAIAVDLVASGAFDLVVLDSVAAVAPSAPPEHDGAEWVRLHADAARRLGPHVERTGTAFIAIDQRRDRPDAAHGPRDRPASGRIIGQAAALAVELEHRGAVLRGARRVGLRVGLRVAANRCGPPVAALELTLRGDRGPWLADEAVGLAERWGLDWRRFLGLGAVDRDAAVDALDADPQRVRALEAWLARTR